MAADQHPKPVSGEYRSMLRSAQRSFSLIEHEVYVKFAVSPSLVDLVVKMLWAAR